MPVHVHKASGSAGLAQGQLPPTRALSTGSKLNRLNSVVGEYAGACVQVARDCGIDVLDLWTLMQEDTQVGAGSVLGVSRIPQTGPCSCPFRINQKAGRVEGSPLPSLVLLLRPAAGILLQDPFNSQEWAE